MIPNKGTLAWIKPIPGLDYHISFDNVFNKKFKY